MWNPRRWPWWGWVLAVVVLLGATVLTALFTYRQHGLGQMRALVEEMHAQGRGMVPADLIARAPAVDRARQARAWALIGPGGGGWGSFTTPVFGLDARLATTKELSRRDAETERILTASAGIRAAWRTVHEEGPVVISNLGWLAEDFPVPDGIGLGSMPRIRYPDMTSLRALATALATDARCSSDPRPALSDLDALIAVQRPVGSLLDAMILLTTSAIRDAAWLEAASRGVDPAPWIGGRDDLLAVVGDGLAAERMLFDGAVYQDALAGRRLSTLFASPGATSWKEGLGNWADDRGAYVTLPADIVFAMRCALAAEDLCRTGIDRSAPLTALMAGSWFRVLHPACLLLVPSMTESAITAVESEASARRARLAGALIHSWLAGGSLPVDSSAQDFPAKDLLPAQRHGPAILYQRLTPTRFRLSTEPAAPTTALMPAGRITPVTPSRERPWTDSHRGALLELDLDAIRPPEAR